MGLLDDAIREHLDLKRRRGADPTEVEREEREVLGPVRRRGDPAHGGELALAHEEDLEHEPLPLDDDPWEEPLAPAEPRRAAAFDHEELEEDERLYGGAGLEPEPYGAPDPYASPEPGRYAADAGHDEDPYGAPDPYAASAPEGDPDVPPPVPRPYPADAGHEPEPVPEPYRADAAPGHYAADPAPHETDETTAEFSVEELHAAEHEPPREGAEEDVLEETPDFLQDTPDHDRLWFEQRPPRDFDFDG
jgi:hypothetical protein